MSTLQIERREYYFWLVIACLVGISVGTVATRLGVRRTMSHA
ncbi:MAG TPA: hypothetical protein VGP63_13340 [Planctomycetaceae bacterium]|jgi:hypothetical protein|nr:hypothetical protein [Planctomycetaceae bacterium]